MSLLNDMLHDLAKQTPSKSVAPQLMAASTKKRISKESILKTSAIILFLSALGLFVYFETQTKTFAVEKNKTQISSEKSVIPKSQEIQSKPKEPIKSRQIQIINSSRAKAPQAQFNSYIEPIESWASEHAVGVQQNNVEITNKGRESIKGQSSVASIPLESNNNGNAADERIHKVYAPQTTEEWANEQVKIALDAIDEGFDEKAIKILESVIGKVPGSKVATENLASLYMIYGKTYEAGLIIDEGLRYAPAEPALLTAKARILVEKGQTIQAVDLLSKYQPSITQYPDYYGTLAAALQAEGHVLETGSIYQALIQIDSRNGQYWLGYALFLEHTKKANQAIEAYTRASQSPDSNASVRELAESRLKILQG